MCADHKRAEHYFRRKTVCNWKAEKLWNLFSRRSPPSLFRSRSHRGACVCVCLCSQDYEWQRRYVLISAGSCSLLVCCNIPRRKFSARASVLCTCVCLGKCWWAGGLSWNFLRELSRLRMYKAVKKDEFLVSTSKFSFHLASLSSGRLRSLSFVSAGLASPCSDFFFF